ncbi:hypothetical protein evm_002047 [Chilo suppressalis]|nr:hypothetical protein evm_002047 [Chilo suppressalis]
MISNKAYIIFALATFNYVLSDEETSQRRIDFGSASDGDIDLPNFAGLSGSGSSPGSFGLPLNLLGLGLPGVYGSPSTVSPEISIIETGRRRRQTDDDDDLEVPELQSRLFFSRLPILSACNYTTQPGSSCLSCRQALKCLPSNIGLLKNCAGLFRHCKNGRCSLTPSSECSDTSTSTSSTTSSSLTSPNTTSSSITIASTTSPTSSSLTTSTVTTTIPNV